MATSRAAKSTLCCPAGRISLSVMSYHVGCGPMESIQDGPDGYPDEWSRIAAEHPGSVLLQTARSDTDNTSSFLFRDALQILCADQLDEIPAIFESIQNALRDGYYVAGFLSYEAGYHFEPAALQSAAPPAKADLPLAWFGIYKEPLVRKECESERIEPASCHGAHPEPMQQCGDTSISI